jgi:hypothetical protein
MTTPSKSGCRSRSATSSRRSRRCTPIARCLAGRWKSTATSGRGPGTSFRADRSS